LPRPSARVRAVPRDDHGCVPAVRHGPQSLLSPFAGFVSCAPARAHGADHPRVSQPPPSWPANRHGVVDNPTVPPLGRPVRRRYVVPLLLSVGLALIVALLMLHDDVKYYRVASGSMQPTLAVGSHVAAEAGLALKIGEIVVFHPPQGAIPATPVCGANGEGAGFQQPCGLAVPEASSAILVKRIVAGPGDLVSIHAGRAVVNGITSSEPFIAPCGNESDCSFPTSVRVPPAQYFLLGDNRGASDDSRFWGPVPASWIVGVVVHCGPLQTACRPSH
jgi:signal peptidase I